ncbi:MAG: vitamin B12 dependent-methionine synthase activation domain-containing protein [Anaerolineales bacterium]
MSSAERILSRVKTLTEIPLQIDRQVLRRNLRLKPGSHHLSELDLLIDQAEKIAKPKAMFRLIDIEAKGEDWVELDGRRLYSRVLRVNLDEAQRAFLFVATAGVELDTWTKSLSDLLHRFWADTIQEVALETARRALHQYWAQRFHAGLLSEMHPGSLDDWPLSAQDDLFALLGDVKGKIGVSMTESKLMYPVKSVSGIAFSTQTHFTSCQLCPRENCRARQAPFDAALFEKRYQLQG